MIASSIILKQSTIWRYLKTGENFIKYYLYMCLLINFKNINEAFEIIPLDLYIFTVL